MALNFKVKIADVHLKELFQTNIILIGKNTRGHSRHRDSN